MKVVVNWITLINLKEIQSFVKFINFYHCFIRNFLKLVKSFTQLIRKNTFFVWNEICVQVFDNLKKQVSLISILRHFNLKRQAILKIDALNYVKGEILSQYNDEKVLHSMIFYSKSMIFTEINYHIYDKKLLVIIQCFKHWWFKLKCIELFIQIFIDHQALKIFMKNKQLSWWQVNYLNILLKFNFQIIFKSGKMNTKVNALTQMSLANVSESAQWLEDHFQTILILNKVDVLLVELKANFYQQVYMINQMNELCNKYKQAINENKLKFHITKLKNCEIIDSVLFRKDLLWVLKNMHTKLLQKIHDQLSISHLDNKQTIDLIQRFYYWSNHQVTVRQYIQNCHVYQRSKASKDSINELHHLLLISQERWKDIVINFITELSLSEDYNVICIIICHLIKEHHYVFCHWKDDNISVKETVWIMLWNIYQLHDLLSSIVSNRDFQFISTMWKSLCKQLRITASLFTVYHLKINDQTKWVNQDVECKLLRAYQDWIKLVSVSSSDLTQSLFSFINISLFNIIFLSTSHSTHVTNTFSSSLAQSLNIT